MINIEHIIINGSGPFALTNYGVAKTLEKNKFFNLDNIKSIYGTSSGAMLGCILCLKYTWEELDSFLINRPWDTIYNIKIENIYDLLNSKGLMGEELFIKMFKPLLCGKDLDIDITLKEFYEYSNIELHIFAVDINTSTLEDISYLNYPNLKLITAIHMTSCLPGFITPVCIDNKCFIDGGLFCNYPLNYCIEKQKCNKDTILGIQNIWNSDDNNLINDESNILDYVSKIVKCLVKKCDSTALQEDIKYNIKTMTPYTNYSNSKDALINSETRLLYINNGVEIANTFLDGL